MHAIWQVIGLIASRKRAVMLREESILFHHLRTPHVVYYWTYPTWIDLTKIMHTKIAPGKTIDDKESASHSELGLLLPFAKRKWFLHLILFPFKVVKCPMI